MYIAEPRVCTNDIIQENDRVVDSVVAYVQRVCATST